MRPNAAARDPSASVRSYSSVHVRFDRQKATVLRCWTTGGRARACAYACVRYALQACGRSSGKTKLPLPLGPRHPDASAAPHGHPHMARAMAELPPTLPCHRPPSVVPSHMACAMPELPLPTPWPHLRWRQRLPLMENCRGGGRLPHGIWAGSCHRGAVLRVILSAPFAPRGPGFSRFRI